MTPREMADLMALNHAGGLGWSEEGIAAMLAQPSVLAVHDAGGFAMARLAGSEAEILTVEVRPEVRGRGIGTRLLSEIVARARAAAVTQLHLEVARDNAAALRLYERAGFETVGTRRGYYRNADGTRIDALLMRRRLEPSGAIDALPLGKVRR